MESAHHSSIDPHCHFTILILEAIKTTYLHHLALDTHEILRGLTLTELSERWCWVQQGLCLLAEFLCDTHVSCAEELSSFHKILKIWWVISPDGVAFYFIGIALYYFVATLLENCNFAAGLAIRKDRYLI